MQHPIASLYLQESYIFFICFLSHSLTLSPSHFPKCVVCVLYCNLNRIVKFAFVSSNLIVQRSCCISIFSYCVFVFVFVFFCFFIYFIYSIFDYWFDIQMKFHTYLLFLFLFLLDFEHRFCFFFVFFFCFHRCSFVKTFSKMPQLV